MKKNNRLIVSEYSPSAPKPSTQVTSCPLTSPPSRGQSTCEGRYSNCWSEGVADLDCPGQAFCCFDGCVNLCQTDRRIDKQTNRGTGQVQPVQTGYRTKQEKGQVYGQLSTSRRRNRGRPGRRGWSRSRSRSSRRRKHRKTY